MAACAAAKPVQQVTAPGASSARPARAGPSSRAPCRRDPRQALVRLLRADGRFEPIPVPGDIPDGIGVDAAVFLHADGAADPRASGFCFGYPPFQVNKRLAELIAAEVQRLSGHPKRRTDNYTADLAQYYGFSKTLSEGPECVVEHGFVTNPQEREWLYGHVKQLARAEYVALCRFFRVEPKPLREEEGELIAAGTADESSERVPEAASQEGAFAEAEDADELAVETPEFDSTIGLSRYLEAVERDPAEIEVEEESPTRTN